LDASAETIIVKLGMHDAARCGRRRGGIKVTSRRRSKTSPSDFVPPLAALNDTTVAPEDS